jgi:hypothetical protein
MHVASSGQVPGSQLKSVQYPPGCVVSQRRSAVAEQSAFTSQASPISGLHPSETKREITAARAIEADFIGQAF